MENLKTQEEIIRELERRLNLLLLEEQQEKDRIKVNQDAVLNHQSLCEQLDVKRLAINEQVFRKPKPSRPLSKSGWPKRVTVKDK